MEKVRATWTFEMFLGATLLFLAVSLSGCGAVGSSTSVTSHPSGTISTSITQAPPSSLAANGTATISATVSNDSANAGVDWSCSPAASCGTFNPAHTASGASTTYTAPAAAVNVTITATSTSSHAATAVANISITAASSGSIAISMTTAPPTTLLPGGTATLAATVTNDSANAGVDWTCTPTGSCGSFTAAHTASGANTTYSAPGAAGAVVITATATSSKTTTATANVAVGATSGGSATLVPGTYTFYVLGEDAKKNTYAIAGSFVLAAGGTITSGEQDYVSAGGAASPATGDTITAGTWSFGSNGLGSLTLVTNNAAVGVAGTETFSIAGVNSKHALIGEFDTGATSSGSIDLQTLASSTLAELSGPFAFVVSGKVGTHAEAFGGLFTANGAGGLNVTELDANEGGTITRGGTNSTAKYTAPDAAGRGTTAFGGNTLVDYVVDAKVLRIVVTNLGEPDIGSAYAGVSGVADASIATSFVFTDASNLSSEATYAAAGKLTLDAKGNVTSGFVDVDENGTNTSAAVTGTYTVNSSGYGTITLTPGATQDISVLGLYLTDPTINPTDPNSPADAGLCGLLLDLDSKLVGSGQLIVLPTAPTTFTGNYALGTQASSAANEGDAVGVVAVSGTSVTGTENFNDLFNTGQGSAIAVSGTLTADAANAGRFTIPLAVSLATNPPTFHYVLYQASSTQFIVLEDDKTQFGIGTLQKQQ